MNIIKHGNPEKLRQIKHFICQKCGCELEADNTEYQSRQVEYNDIGYFIKCPDCGNEIWWDKSKERLHDSFCRNRGCSLETRQSCCGCEDYFDSKYK